MIHSLWHWARWFRMIRIPKITMMSGREDWENSTMKSSNSHKCSKRSITAGGLPIWATTWTSKWLWRNNSSTFKINNIQRVVAVTHRHLIPLATNRDINRFKVQQVLTMIILPRKKIIAEVTVDQATILSQGLQGYQHNVNAARLILLQEN
jgi:hypothetical protein